MRGDSTMIKLLKLGEELYPSELMLEGCGSFYHTWNEWTASIQKLMGDDRARAGGGRVWGGESSQIMRWKCGEQEYNIEMKGASVGMDIGWLNGLYTTLKVLRDEWTTGIQKLMGDGLGDNGYT
ncbi:hypothetical protein T05_272 [Trichinella murrelli]|uniref:Uncharacterized protein n=1 Tax=Trichinella murrelli TaxID=144512 RepID=A0A0V0T794_9BILA|nr:hypothetical protein T05_13722 [Trichinella murrelli]KRX44854.1 hypothetical protein T05_272 [Trichinella murrelli]